MSEEKVNGGAAALCCLFVFLKLCIQTPLWAVLFYGILSSIENVPIWVWVLFWVYIPVSFGVGALGELADLALEKS